ncbi:hypothetical protein [Moorena sp. SIO3F7]|uniref:hypothetical protein n=1 Tax=Moorena sp. SIO3F7 TaxID=2607839 RepID=UPI0014011C91|nr:hypothetical protein [Moorena sp. SIO3F7]NEP98842.1 hypothetical protein [Moorena sp. SIO3F7]
MEIKPPAIPNSFEALELLPQSVLFSSEDIVKTLTPSIEARGHCCGNSFFHGIGGKK